MYPIPLSLHSVVSFFADRWRAGNFQWLIFSYFIIDDFWAIKKYPIPGSLNSVVPFFADRWRAAGYLVISFGFGEFTYGRIVF